MIINLYKRHYSFPALYIEFSVRLFICLATVADNTMGLIVILVSVLGLISTVNGQGKQSYYDINTWIILMVVT